MLSAACSEAQLKAMASTLLDVEGGCSEFLRYPQNFSKLDRNSVNT